VNNIAQSAALVAVSGPLDAVVEMRTAFDRRRRTMHRLLEAIDGVTCVEPQGAFYAFPNMQGLLNREIEGTVASSTLELADVFLEKANVAIVPGEAFGASGYARLSFALSDEDLVEGLTRITDLVNVR
jgi:aspartate/methionine/tyrosine aminotransferase